MSRQKICFVIPEYNLKTPTHLFYLYDFIELLSKQYDIFLVAEKGSGKVIGVTDYYIQKLRFLPFRALENLAILLLARLRGYSLFYIHYSFLSAFQAVLIARLLGGRTWYWNCGLPWLYKRGFFREKFERSVYWLVTFLVTGTESLKNQYAEHYHLSLSKIKVMPNWINIEQVTSDLRQVTSNELKKKLNIPAGAKILLFAHRLSKRKGAHYLPEILNQLKDKNIFLLVVGDGPEKQNIQLQIANYQLQNKIKFLGWVPQSEVAHYFAIADAFLLPSEEEGFPHVLLESMAAGLPFVSFDIGGVSEIIPTAAKKFLVSPGNIKKFSDRVRELLNLEETKKNTLKVSLLEWVRQFDIKNVASRFQKIIEDSLDVAAGKD